MPHYRRLLVAAAWGVSLLAVSACDEPEGRDGGSLVLPDADDEDENKSDDTVDPGTSGGTWSVAPRVKVYAFDPTLQSGERLSESQGWNDAHFMSFDYRDAVRRATWDSVDYQVEKFSRIDEFPRRTDGDRYTEQSYLDCLANTDTCLPDSPYMTDLAHYAELFGWCEEARNGVDEIWVFGAPWFGMPESQMTGKGAYWLNSTPLETGCDTPLVIMAYSYHVPASNMMHNLGHRIESHLSHAFGSWPSDQGPSPWEQFSRRAENSDEPECGNVHWPPSTEIEYGYWDTAEASSGCDRWLDYPNHADVAPEPVSCFTWGCDGDTQLNYLQWWVQHIPHTEGTHEGFLTNWQRYIFDYRSHM